jgi:hypothetical protein
MKFLIIALRKAPEDISFPGAFTLDPSGKSIS